MKSQSSVEPDVCAPKGRSCVVLAVLFAATAARAQLASDEVPHQRTLPVSQEIRQTLESSRLRFGIFRLQPAFTLHDFGYDNNVFGTTNDAVADWHSSVSAGTRFIVPLGSRMYFRGTVMPEYTWYRKVTQLRAFGGEYEGSLLGLFNRLSLDADAHLFKGLSVVNSELERQALGTRSDASGNAEIEILRRLSLFGTAHAQRQRYQFSEQDRAVGIGLDQLERNEAVLRSGIRYRFASFLDVSVAAEKTKTDFLTATDRDNKSGAVLLGVRYDRPRSFVSLSVGSRRGEAQNATSTPFPRYRTSTGSYYASHELSSRILLDVYGHRGVVYGLYVDNPYYLETRNGGGLTLPVGRRLALRGFGEVGANAYPVTVQSVRRNDDVTSWGGGFAFRLYRRITLVALASDTRYTSNVPGQSRSIFRVATTISTQAELFR